MGVSNFLHLGQLFCTSDRHVQEGQAIEVLGLLICPFHDLYSMLVIVYRNGKRNRKNLVVSLLERLLCQPVPALQSIDALRRFQCDIKVATFNSKVEPRILVLNEVKRDLNEYSENKLLFMHNSAIPRGSPFAEDTQ